MPLIDLTLQHGRTLDEARRRLEATVTEAQSRFGSMIQRVEWAPDGSRVKVDGVGFWVEMSVDAVTLHAVGDIPVLGRLLGGQFVLGLRQIVEDIFQKKLPG
jgi:putative polyhydroxyalkanoic acid system protein